MNTAEKFWARVSKGSPEQCWEWKGAVNSSGYGNLSWGGTNVQAHRLAYFLTFGGIELKTGFRISGRAKAYREFVLHKCDNRLCCNPTHFFLGSMSENQTDAYDKRRKAQPQSKHVNAKLGPDQVREIRKGSKSQRAFAAAYGVSQRAVCLVAQGRTYRDIV